MKYAVCFFLFLSINLFAGKQEIEKKYNDVMLEYQGFQKVAYPLGTENKELIFDAGVLHGLKFALENFEN